MYSASKTVTALAIGMAREDGLLDLEDRLVDRLPAVGGPLGEGVGEVRLRHLLTMTSGSPLTGLVDEERLAPDLAATFCATDLVAAPGERFLYSSASTYLLSRVIAHVTGRDLRDYLMPRLFEPLGILNPQWFRCRQGFSWGGSGLHLRTSELALIGRLLLQRGRWDGEDLVPGAWVDALHETWVDTGWPDPENARYGLQVWDCTPEGVWRADGAFGQFSIVMPHQQAVVTLTSHHEGNLGDVLRAVWEELLPELEG